MPRPATLPSRSQLGQRILQVSAEVFAQKGFHAASMRDIARRLRCTPAALYYHADNKEDLLYRIASTAFEKVLEPLSKPSFQSLPVLEQLRFIIHNHLRHFAQNLNLMKVLAHESHHLHGRHYQVIQKMQRSYVNLVIEVLNRINVDSSIKKDVDSLRWNALSLFGMMNWIYTWFREKDIAEIDVYAEHVYSLFLHGFMATETQINNGSHFSMNGGHHENDTHRDFR